MPLPIGRFIIDSSIYSSLVLSRVLSGDENYYFNIGSFSTGSGQHTFFMSVKDVDNDAVKQYSFSMNHNHTAGSWFSINPLDVSSASLTFTLEVQSDGAVVNVRVRRIFASTVANFQIVCQNLGRADSSFVEDTGVGTDTTASAGELSSIPFGSSGTDHNQLANRGVYPHATIDAHINSTTGHSGHENVSNKGQANGYPGLSSTLKLFPFNIPFGTSAGTVCAGDDSRLQGGLIPGDHAYSHMSGGTDEINLGDLQGSLPQAKSHASPDTDTSTNSLHHTLGTGANQAASGDHNHDSAYATKSSEIPEGVLHDHDGTNSAKVSHLDLEDAGSYTHTNVDSHIDASTPHSGHEDKANKNAPLGYAGLDNSSKHISSQIPFGTASGTVCEGNDPRLEGERPPEDHASSHYAGGADELDISYTVGDIEQSRSHESPDTDASATALHHTLGTGENQAAAGNHQHTLEYDLRYAGIVNGVTNGDLHDHSGGDGGTISHFNLEDTGVNTHTEIDAHIDDIAPHSGHESLSNKGQPDGYAALTNEGYVPLNQLPPEAKREIKVVGDIATRDLLAAFEGLRAHVLDATDDPTVSSGWAEYIYGPVGWVKTAELESIDVNVEWSNISGIPSSTPSEIDSAVSISHTENGDTFLALGTSNQTGASEIREHLDHDNPHFGHEVVSAKGQANGYVPLDASSKIQPVFVKFGVDSGSVCEGNDPRLEDSRTPISHEIISELGLGQFHSISGGVFGHVFMATGYNSAGLAQLQHENLGKAGAYSHADIDAHIEDPAPHANHSLLGHHHDGSDIDSQVSDADTVDGKHADEFSLDGHGHSLSDMEDTDFSAVSTMDFVVWDGAAFTGKDLIEVGAEPAFSKNTAFNKDFGAIAGSVAMGDHLHTGVYSEIDHLHTGVYSPSGHDHSGVYLGIASTAADSSKLGNKPPSTLAGVADTIPATDATGAIALTNVTYDSTNSMVSSAPLSRIYVSGDTKIKHMTPANFAGALKSDMLTALLTVDGSGSGLDADTLDGVHASSFATSSHVHTILTRGTGLTGNNYNGGTATTWAVSYGTAAGTSCQGNDSRLSNARTPTAHTHGNITNAGAIGAVSGLPIVTTSSGVLTTGAYFTGTPSAPTATGSAGTSTNFSKGDHAHPSRIATSAPASPVNGDIWMV